VRVAVCLGEDQPALEAGQGGSGQPVDVGPGPELAWADHGGQARADVGFPPLEARGQDSAGPVVTFAELADEVSDGAAAAPAALLLEGASALTVGDVLEPFALNDATGAQVTPDELVETGPAVIVFYRGGWCPYCNLALRAYQRELLPELAAFGARLVAISPQSPDQSLCTAEKAGLDFTVLSDPGSRVARRIGITFEQADDVLAAQRTLGLGITQVNAEGSVTLPRPAVLIVGPDRTVCFIDIQPDYTARTEVADILAALAGSDSMLLAPSRAGEKAGAQSPARDDSARGAARGVLTADRFDEVRTRYAP
jgi:peroxiredoxin